MSAPVRFDKYEGLGNDFLVVEASEPLPAGVVEGLCDRHFGVGADGLLVVGLPRSSGAQASMIVQNADGSRPEMCGNGLRCVALHLARAAGAARADVVVDTDAGPLRCETTRDGDWASVALDLGRAHALGDHVSVFDGAPLVFRRISIGNPHAVCIDGPLDPAIVDRLGPLVSSQIPGGANVETVVHRGGRTFELVVFERGVGRTLACGTGAAATAAALALAGRAPYGVPLEMVLPGGMLEVRVAEGTLDLHLRGPARRVFSGEVAGEIGRPAPH